MIIKVSLGEEVHLASPCELHTAEYSYWNTPLVPTILNYSYLKNPLSANLFSFCSCFHIRSLFQQITFLDFCKNWSLMGCNGTILEHRLSVVSNISLVQH